MTETNWLEIEYKETSSQLKNTSEAILKISTLAYTINSAALAGLFVIDVRGIFDSINIIAYMISPILIISNIYILKSSRILHSQIHIYMNKLSTIEDFVSQKIFKDETYRLSLYNEIEKNIKENKFKDNQFLSYILIAT